MAKEAALELEGVIAEICPAASSARGWTAIA